MKPQHWISTLVLIPLFFSCALTRDIEALSVSTPDLELVQDGIWTGECRTALIYAKTEVTVVAHRMEALRILAHENGLGGPAETITDRVLAAQTLEVDVVSGATGSSRVILKSIEQALLKGMAP